MSSTYDSINRVQSRTFPEGNRVEFDYEDETDPTAPTLWKRTGNVTVLRKIPKPDSGLSPVEALAEYADPSFPDKPTRVRDFEGNWTDIAYGQSGGATAKIVEVEQPAVTDGTSGSTLRPTWTFTYTAWGREADMTDPTGLLTRNAYYGGTASAADQGRLKSTTVDPGGLALVTSFAWDAAGNRISVTDPRGHTSQTAYNLHREPTVETDALGNLTEMVYDLNGRVIRVRRKDASGTLLQATAMEYTPTGEEARVIGPCSDGLESNPACAVREMAYDALDREEFVTDPEGRVTRFVYDLAGQLLEERRAVGTALEQVYAAHGYTPNGLRARVRDANCNVTEFSYDGFDRLARTDYPSAAALGASCPGENLPDGGDFEAFTYDANGTLLTKTTRAGDVIANTYDAAGQRKVYRVIRSTAPGSCGRPAPSRPFGRGEWVGRARCPGSAFGLRPSSITRRITSPRPCGIRG